MTDRKQDGGSGVGSGVGGGAGSGGGIAIGRMTGGAVAAGDRAQAESRTERAGNHAERDGRDAHPGTGLAPVPAEAPGHGGVAVGELSGGAVAAGRQARAVDSSREALAVPPELLEAVAELRRQLPLLVRAEGDGVDAVGDELAGLEDEARRTGRTHRGRLVRLRALLSSGTTAAGGLASAATVAEAAGRLLA
ncbi:hypothetical protein FGW37_20100 [Streptomyces rectiverticillatus]|uniref:hypothetical protein n=1 Tax=Streptomyces rectiverticillatus TaxID=173860 RepID=UPI0015C3C4FC|nr:hypothetical protein [Streptomyces rectiverticillatus]QLE73577.1 hypothetical protein FGW37_20100 [Streptomyces rectiverticillatus]